MSLQHSSYTHQPIAADLEEGKDSASAAVTLELPPMLRFFINISSGASPIHRAVALLCNLVVCTGFAFPLFASITESVVVGVTISVLGFFSGMGELAFINFAKPSTDAKTEEVKMRLLREFTNTNTVSHVSEIKGSIIMMVLLNNCVLMPCVYFLLIFPTMGVGGSMNYILRDNATWVLWLGFILCEAASLGNAMMTALMQPIMQLVQKTWTCKLRAYVKKIHGILIDLGASAEASKNESLAMAEIAAEQTEIEAWATSMNKLHQNFTGFGILSTLMWIFVPIAVLALNPTASSTAEVGILCFLSLMYLVFFAMTLSAATKPNIAWNQSITSMLFDARVQNINVKLIQNRFQPWLDSHEINAARAFGVKVTVSRLRQSVSLVASVFALLMYFILREELRTMM